MDTLKTDDPEMTSAEEHLDRLLSVEALQGASGNLIAKVHGLIQEITINRQLQSMVGHRSLSQPALPKPALRKLSKDDASELIYNFAQTSGRRLLGQCMGRPMPPSAEMVLDQVIKLMTDVVMDSLTYVSQVYNGGWSLSPADVKADGMAPSSSARGEETKKNRKWRFLPKMHKFPKIMIKLFKTKGEPKRHPEQDALPTNVSERLIFHREDLTTTPAPAPQESQSRKRPLIVRVLHALSRAISKPFRGASGKKN
ncbi:hypothetical protein J4Q44_G00383810 [Coregonus suidteri]|uniref:Uncharacterized protein n=1 Tax=Coregonus suidteri TaxID=861788 RepID=A0AAN8KF26_9TELE